MGVLVTKVGPFYSSGAISFSSLRSNFKETSSGEIRASEYRKNTNVGEENPIVPDSTENENIATGSNLRLSQFRNSVKRYVATQSGIDDNQSYPGEPGFRMGRFASNGRGIDWCGGGVSGPDGQSGGTSGNLTKNIQKSVYITGTCGSVISDMPAAQLQPDPAITVHNVRIYVSGSILGYGGLGSTVENGNAQSGNSALNLGNIGYNNRVIISSGARIYGGGGGGEKGARGANGVDGTCFNYSYYTAGSGCEWCGSCGSGERIGGCGGASGCRCFIICLKTRLHDAQCRRRDTFSKIGGDGGIGGNGGNGRGYNNLSGSISGSVGLSGQPGNCDGSSGTITTPGTGKNGEKGGDGGDWGQRGSDTSASGNPGNGGKAISKTSSNSYSIEGPQNSDTIRGNIY